MDLIDGQYGFAGQLTAQDIQELVQQGVKSFICNRPDGEEPGQPDRAELEQAASQAGAVFHFLPLAAGTAPSRDLLLEYTKVFQETEKPVIVFCRSGKRSSVIHASSRAMQV